MYAVPCSRAARSAGPSTSSWWLVTTTASASGIAAATSGIDVTSTGDQPTSSAIGASARDTGPSPTRRRVLIRPNYSRGLAALGPCGSWTLGVARGPVTTPTAEARPAAAAKTRPCSPGLIRQPPAMPVCAAAWVEEHDGTLASVIGTAADEPAGVQRIDFPGGAGEDSTFCKLDSR
jgi:hypothetical protein